MAASSREDSFLHLAMLVVLVSALSELSRPACAFAGEFAGGEHRTKAATEKLPALSCYRCDNMVDGQRCIDIKDDNSSTDFIATCPDDARICQVKRISITTLSKTAEAPVKPKVWSLTRNCTGNCESGCIVIGERTKLYACTTCCEESRCNYGNRAATTISTTWIALFNYLWSLFATASLLSMK